MSSFFLPAKGSSRDRKRKKVKADKKVRLNSSTSTLKGSRVCTEVACTEGQMEGGSLTQTHTHTLSLSLEIMGVLKFYAHAVSPKN